MRGDGLTEKLLVFALDARHFHHFFEAFRHFEFFREIGGVDIFLNILTLESSRKIHREKPAGNVTGHTKRAADRPEDLFTKRVRVRVEMREPFRDVCPMRPFFGLDFFDAFLFGGIFHGFPMSAIRVSGRKLARVSVLKNADEILTGGFYQISVRSS